jgi:hypothetical protein
MFDIAKTGSGPESTMTVAATRIALYCTGRADGILFAVNNLMKGFGNRSLPTKTQNAFQFDLPTNNTASILPRLV